MGMSVLEGKIRWVGLKKKCNKLNSYMKNKKNERHCE